MYESPRSQMRDARSLAVARSHFSPRVTALDLILWEISATEIAVIYVSITKYSLLLKIRELPAHNTAYMACSIARWLRPDIELMKRYSLQKKGKITHDTGIFLITSGQRARYVARCDVTYRESNRQTGHIAATRNICVQQTTHVGDIDIG